MEDKNKKQKEDDNNSKDVIREMLVLLNIVGFGTVGFMIFIGLFKVFFN